MVTSVESQALTSHAGHTLFTPKACIHLDCWNARSLGKRTRQNGRLREVLRTLKEKKIELLTLSEVRWPVAAGWYGGHTFRYGCR